MNHEHRKSKTCRCYILGDEPNWRCPIHGDGEYPPRCEVCGQFFRVAALQTREGGTK